MSESQFVFIEGNNFPEVTDILNEANSRNYVFGLDDQDAKPLHTISGYWPCKLDGNDTGFEFYIGEIEQDDIENFETDKTLIKSKTHIIDLVFRDEDEYKSAAIFAAIMCKLCNGITYDEHDELRITTKNAVKWAKKIKKNGFNSTADANSKSDLWVKVIGKSVILDNDLQGIIGKELKDISFTGVWAGGIGLHFDSGFRFYASAWSMHGKNKKIFDVTRYKQKRTEELKIIYSIGPSGPSPEQEKVLKKLEQESDKAIAADEKETELAKKDLLTWPKRLTVATVKYNNKDTIYIGFKEVDECGFSLQIMGDQDDITFGTPYKREFHLKLENT